MISEKQLKEILEMLEQTNAFKSLEYDCTDINGNFGVKLELKDNYTMSEPLNPQTESKFRQNPYNRLLKSKKHFYCLNWFPSKATCPEDAEQMPLKYKTRFENLLESINVGNIAVWNRKTIAYEDLLEMKYHAKPYDKSEDKDFQDNEMDRTCKLITQEVKQYIEIKRVCTSHSTLIILDNAKMAKDKALSYYSTTTQFYSDIVIHYILQHADLLNPDNFKYENKTQEVRIQQKQLKKLFPHKTFKLELPNGVNLTYIRADRRTTTTKSRISPNDTAIFTFSADYLKNFIDIIQRKTTGNAPQSFIKFPVFFLLEALKKENFGANGFNFLLWLLPFFRMSNPRILTSTAKILEQLDIDITSHGVKEPLERLEHYFDVLDKYSIITAPTGVKFKKKFIEAPPKISGKFIELKKPKKIK